MKKYILLVLFITSACGHRQITPNTVNYAAIEDSPKTSGSVLQVQPEYPGGIPAFFKFITDEFKKPKIGHAATLKIMVSFIVEKDGTMSNYKIVQDPGYGLGNETVRVLKLCKQKWKPGVQNGKIVRAAYNLPLTINIKK